MEETSLLLKLALIMPWLGWFIAAYLTFKIITELIHGKRLKSINDAVDGVKNNTAKIVTEQEEIKKNMSQLTDRVYELEENSDFMRGHLNLPKRVRHGRE